MVRRSFSQLAFFLVVVFLTLCPGPALAAEEAAMSMDEKLDAFLEPVAYWADKIVFFSIPVGGHSVPIVLLLLAGTGVFLTLFFKFINFRAFRLALRTVRGKYSSEDDPGQITHFQALATALSATVGLGNIAGVAVAIGIGGPGAVFWMVVMGLLGMTSKFAECTLGVAYRFIDSEGRVHGGAMRYLENGMREHGVGGLGRVLAIVFAVACVGGALGAGNMFQINQSAQQIGETFGIFNDGQSWILGVIVAAMVGAVIIGGIVWIARVTAVLVPFMTIIYVLACIVVLGGYVSEIPAALGTIFREAFSFEAGLGGFLGGLIQGIKRGVFSNEAGLGSAAIAHAPVKTRRPASEGVVALLEPFTDTVIICLMTALVIVTTGVWKADASINTATELREGPSATAPVVRQLAERDLIHIVTPAKEGEPWMEIEMKDRDAAGHVLAEAVTERTGWSGGIWLTSRSFGSVIPWFPYVLTVAVFLFAFSTMISWSYYGEQAIYYLVGGNQHVITAYKLVFCGCVVVGAAASLKNVLMLSDALYFAMVAPNLIGLYFLLPRIRRELDRFLAFSRKVDGGATLKEADQSEA
ncbi:alanine/glycine:cation symporter family protein [Haloferula sp. A504]|uniref:alanine/glycine:cation symporter family protein n=1 Tax=Haloferula sp. A504 TaxID=3373601 RepID=UPI0031CA8155|nr:alanine:cation symporter family protein [Verrucomicrobiaceae bacterium E54]